MPEFCHLHCHTQYSLLDGAARIKPMLERARNLEIPAVAITDHGNLFGVPEFYHTAKNVGVQPIIGCEFYLTPSGMHDRTDSTRYHQVLLAKNETGYRNLIKLSSLSYLEGFYRYPRIDLDLLRKHHEGLIATTCCLQGHVLQTILHRGEEEARAIFETYLDIFGEDYYIEIQDHGIPEQKRCNAVLLKWAREYNVKVIATNDVHYIEEEDHDAQDVLLCLQTGKDYHDPDRMRFEKREFYLKSLSQMQKALADLDPLLRDATLDTTREVADKCQLELPMGKLLMPNYPIPEQFKGDMDAYLHTLVFEGAAKRYGEPLPEAVRERLNYELDIIRNMGYAGYFLIVQDFTSAARKLGVRVGPGRGSAAGSAVAYCLGITNIDPLQYDLLFERFLNPERVSMPDIDIDFDDRGRAKVIDYVVNKYGRESVCQIITFGTMGARSVIRDVARVLNIPLSEADRIAKLIPETPKARLEDALREVPELARLEKDPDPVKRKLIHYARVLEGSARHTGVHAAGVIIAPGEVSDYVPVATAKSKGGQSKVVVTQYDGNWVEKFGLLKMDFLGLKTLTIINDTLELIRHIHGVDINPDDIPLDDPKTLELFQRGDTVAVFQFESEGMRNYLRELKPTTIDDLIAMNALYRPGPMDLIPTYIRRKHGEEPVEYPHPLLEPVLKNTYGIPIYQEQVMQMAQVMAGYTLGQADLLRRSMGKKKVEEMKKHRDIFVAGAAERGVDERTAHAVFDMMEKFAGYGFNKCVTGDTEIVDTLTGRIVKVQDLYEGRALVGRTLSCDTQSLHIHPETVLDVVDNGVKPVYRLRTASGKEIEATANHPFLTFSGWKPLNQLSVGQFIATPRHLPVEGTLVWPEHHVIVMGYLLMTTVPQYAPVFSTTSTDLLADFVRAAEQFDNVKCTVSIHRDNIYVVGTKPRNPRRPIELRFWAQILEIAGRLASEQVIPDEIFSLTNEQIALLLSRMWEYRGAVNLEEKRLTLSLASRKLAQQIQHLLLRFGIISQLESQAPARSGHPHVRLHIRGKQNIERFIQHIARHRVREAFLDALDTLLLYEHDPYGDFDRLPPAIKPLIEAYSLRTNTNWSAIELVSGISKHDDNTENIGTLPHRRGYPRQAVAQVATLLNAEEIKKQVENDIYWDEIVAIEYTGLKQTYDLEIARTHNFVANDIIVHNSHSAAYSVVAYQTGYLKAHYPAEFMAAVMTSEMGDAKKLAVALEEARRMGLTILPPSINASNARFTVEDGSIRFGLAAIKGVGVTAVEAIVTEREAHGPFRSIFDLCKRINYKVVNRKMLEALIAAGALDELEGHRAQLMEALETAIAYGQRYQMDQLMGQNSLFESVDTPGSAAPEPPLPVTQPWPLSYKLKQERELLGFYISGHPLDRYAPVVRALATAQLGNPDDVTPGQEYRFCGIITEVRERLTRQGKPMAFVTLEDYTGSGEIVLFAEQLERHRAQLRVDEIIMVQGVVDIRGGEIKIRAREILPLWMAQNRYIQSIILKIQRSRVTRDQLQELLKLCDRNRGSCKLHFEVADASSPPLRLYSRKFLLDPSPEFIEGVTRLLGAEHVAFEVKAS